MIDARHVCLATSTSDGEAWPAWYTSAWLTVPGELRRDELQILVHGAGVDHRYWHWPLEPERYSYVSWAAERGIATLAIDRIGCGHSSRPPGVEVTVAAQAGALAQIVDSVRTGRQGMPPFSRVVLVGHSIGSVVCGWSAATRGGVDAVVLTGYLPVDGTVEMGTELFDFAFRPAIEGMPQLRGQVDDDYLVAREGLGVDELRYWLSQADPGIMAFETLIKGPATRAELRDAAVAGPMIRSVTVPALGLVGQHDALLVDAGLGDSDAHDAVRRVASAVGPSFEFIVIPDTGHMLNLQRNAHESFAAIERWLSS